MDFFFIAINPANIYSFKDNKRNTRKRCKICSNLTIKTPERSGVFINLEHISYFFSKFNVDFEQGNVIGWEI